MKLSEAFADQSASCTRLGSPFMGQLCGILARHWPDGSKLDARIAACEGDIGPAGASFPLRLAGGLHALVLSGRAPELDAVYPPHQVQDGEMRRVVTTALHTYERFLLDWIEGAPQTNEVRRSAALMAAAAVSATHTDLPVWLSELGASGGLNMMWDHFALKLADRCMGASNPVLTLAPDWEGPMPPMVLPHIAAREGVDLYPLDPQNPDDLLRMTAFLWPDQPERLALTRAAAAIMDAPVSQGDAIDWLEKRLDTAPSGHLHLIQHTVAWQYFPRHAQIRGRRLIEEAGAAASHDRPLAWLAMETDGDTKGALGALLTLRLWPGDIMLRLGRADFHGRWIRWAGIS